MQPEQQNLTGIFTFAALKRRLHTRTFEICYCSGIVKLPSTFCKYVWKIKKTQVLIDIHAKIF